MKKLAITMICVCAGVGTLAAQSPKVIAHRGFWKSVPEVPHNSIASLQNAIELGCFGTEFDIWVTSDGIPVIFHDPHTGAKKISIQDVTYAELMEQDGMLANGEKIPTLEEYLATWKKSDKKVKLIFEIKSHKSAEHDRYAVEKVLQIISKHKIKSKNMEFIAFSRHVCRALVDLKCGAPVAYLSGDLAPADAKQELGITSVDYNMWVFKKNPSWIKEAQELDLVVNVWTVNSEDDLKYVIEAGVDYITTDRPDVLMKMLALP